MNRPTIKTMTIDGFYTLESAKQISAAVGALPFVQSVFGKEIEQFNMVSEDVDEIFSLALGKDVIVDREKSGVFRIPEMFIHFEDSFTEKDWLFVVALENSTFNIFEHQSGAENALFGHKYNYRNLFEWELTVNYLLKPGQGIFFKPWLFHSFNNGLIQIFTMKEQ